MRLDAALPDFASEIDRVELAGLDPGKENSFPAPQTYRESEEEPRIATYAHPLQRAYAWRYCGNDGRLARSVSE